MECPRCSGLEMEDHTAEDGAVIGRCTECKSVWIDSGDLTRSLLHNNQPGLDALGGRENLAETAGVCPEDLTDLVVIESTKSHDHAFAMCEVCGGVWLSGDEENDRYQGASGDDLIQEIIGFFQEFAPAKTAHG